MSSRQVLRNALIVDGTGQEPYWGDLAVIDDHIVAIGEVRSEPGDADFDCSERAVMPGFIDAHSHADAQLFRPEVQHALLRQGVTTVIGGQDGVSYAPGDGAYASEYFVGVNGAHPTYRGSRVSDLLSTYDATTRLNFAYLVPGGTVRYEVMANRQEPAGTEQLQQMQQLVRDGIEDGAIGLSTGLDYVPGLFSDTAELAALCAPVAEAGAMYVSHMRGGYEANSAAGLDEIAEICDLSGVRAHVSHFHTDAGSVEGLLASLQQRGVDITFDAYPYVRGCTTLAMPLLPPDLAARPTDEVVAALRLPDVRRHLREVWFPEVARNPSLGPRWADMITLSHVADPAYEWALGLTIAQASERSGQDTISFSCDLLAASRLEVNAIMAVPHERPAEELGRILSHDAHISGSDGIFIGKHPHPRANGTFARYLREFVRELGFYTWQSAAVHLSARPAQRFELGERGLLARGSIADLIVVDTDTVRDNATYENPLPLAAGIDDVWVAGVQVLREGELTEALPGQALRRQPSR